MSGNRTCTDAAPSGCELLGAHLLNAEQPESVMALPDPASCLGTLQLEHWQ